MERMSAPSPRDTLGAADAASAAASAAETAPPTDGASSSSDATQSLWRALWSTTPDTPLIQVQSPLGEGRSHARIWRGIQKMGGSDEIPAAVDILWGFVELVIQSRQPQSSSSTSRSGDPNQESSTNVTTPNPAELDDDLRSLINDGL